MSNSHNRTSIGPEPWVTKHSHLIPSGQILDLACGSGRHGRYFLPSHEIIFLDKDISGVEDLVQQPNVQLMEFDLETEPLCWPFKPKQFAAIIVVNYLHRPLFNNLIKALIPGGILIYKTFAEGTEKFGRPKNPKFLLKKNELRQIRNKALEIINFTQGKESPPDRITQAICARKLSNRKQTS